MMKDYLPKVYYELNCGQPVLHRDGKPVTALLDSVAIAYDASEERIVLHKHGEAQRVKAWVESTQRKLSTTSEFGKEMAKNLKLIELKVRMPPHTFPVDLLNEAISGNDKSLRELIARDGVIEVQAVEVNHERQHG